MTALAVSGYSSMDYAIGLDGQIEGEHTTLISYRDTTAWPRLGGCPSYVCVAAAGLGQKAQPISWIGRDDNAEKLLVDLQAANVSTDGIARIDGPSPMAVLAYQADGSCACLFDPAFAGREDLTETQRGIIAAASHICITAGPPHLISDILAARDPDTRLYWICKNDAHCFTDEIRVVLSVEADVIFCNRSERDLIMGHRADAIVVETRGTDGISISVGAQAAHLEIDPVAVRDTTGAGDTFAGGFIASEMRTEISPRAAADNGLRAARNMLSERLKRERA